MAGGPLPRRTFYSFSGNIFHTRRKDSSMKKPACGVCRKVLLSPLILVLAPAVSAVAKASAAVSTVAMNIGVNCPPEPSGFVRAPLGSSLARFSLRRIITESVIRQTGRWTIMATD